MEKNKTVYEINELLNRDQELELKYKKLQRQRDLKVDTIDKEYTNKIEKVLRERRFIKMQMKQAKEFANENLGGK